MSKWTGSERPRRLGTDAAFEKAYAQVLAALRADEGSLHVTVRRAYLELLLAELDRGIDQEVRHAVNESCLEGIQAHLDRCEDAGKPPSEWNLRAILYSYGRRKESDDHTSTGE